MGESREKGTFAGDGVTNGAASPRNERN
jgi:hypothetical protein